jgi:hypothetical protein
VETLSRNDMGFIYCIYFGIVCLANFLSVLLLVGAYHDFRFVVDLGDQDSTEANISPTKEA